MPPAVAPPPVNTTAAAAPSVGLPGVPDISLELPAAPPPSQPPSPSPPCTDKSCLDDPLAPKLAGLEVKAILEAGAPVDLNKRRHLMQTLAEEGAGPLRMTPPRFAPAWLEYDLYARHYVKAVELSLDIPAGLTANASYGSSSTVLTGDATLTAQLSYGGTLVQVSLVDPAYDGESTVYVLHAHRELRPDAPSLPALSATAAGGNVAITFEAVRESAFDDLAAAADGDSATGQPASHYVVTVTNSEQLAKGAEVTIRYSLITTPDWADGLTATWAPAAAVVSPWGAESLVVKPPNSLSITYVANATTRLLLRSGDVEYSYAIEVDLGARLQSGPRAPAGNVSNQNDGDGLGVLDDDGSVTIVLDGAPPPPAEEEGTPLWLFLAIGGAGIALLLAVCCCIGVCISRRRRAEASRGRAVSSMLLEDHGAAFNDVPSIGRRVSLNPLYGGAAGGEPVPLADAFSGKSRETEWALQREDSIPASMRSNEVMDTWLNVAAAGSNPMFGGGGGGGGGASLLSEEAMDRSAFSDAAGGADAAARDAAARSSVLMVSNNPLMGAYQEGSDRQIRASMMTMNPLAMAMGGGNAGTVAPNGGAGGLDDLMYKFDAGGMMAAAEADLSPPDDLGGWVQCEGGGADSAYWVNAASGEIASEMPQVVFESEMRQIEHVAENLESVALELDFERFAVGGAALGARDATKALFAAMESGDDMESRNAAIHADGLMRSLEEAVAAPAAAASPDSLWRLKRVLGRVRAKLNPVLALAKAGFEEKVRTPAEVNVSSLALELRRRRQQLRRAPAALRRLSSLPLGAGGHVVTQRDRVETAWNTNPAFDG